jgi:hypothetical protein
VYSVRIQRLRFIGNLRLVLNSSLLRWRNAEVEDLEAEVEVVDLGVVEVLGAVVPGGMEAMRVPDKIHHDMIHTGPAEILDEEVMVIRVVPVGEEIFPMADPMGRADNLYPIGFS